MSAYGIERLPSDVLAVDPLHPARSVRLVTEIEVRRLR